MRCVLLRNSKYGISQVRAFGRALADMGHDVHDRTNIKKGSSGHFDVGVVFGRRRHNMPNCDHLIVIESGYFLRDLSLGKETLWSVNYGAMLDVPKTPTLAGLKRFSNNLDKNTASLPGFKKREPVSNKTLVLSQIPKDRSHPFKNITRMVLWLSHQISDSDEIVFRSHPGFPAGDAVPENWQIDTTDTIQESLRCHSPARVVCYSSTAGLLALCDGYNVACSETAWYSGLGMIEAGILASQCSFTTGELESGVAAEYLTNHCRESHGVELKLK